MRYRISRTHSRRFISFQNTLKFCLNFVGSVIWDAEDPCSVNTAYDPESSFTMSPRSATLLLYLWNCGSNAEFLRWQRSNDAKCSFLTSFLATSFLFLTFLSCHADIFSNFSHSFPPGIFIAWGIGTNFVHELSVTQWFHPCCCNVIFMILVRNSFQSDSHRFVSCPAALTKWSCTRHCCWHRHF